MTDFHFIHLSCKLGYAYNEFGSISDQMEVVWVLEMYKYDEGQRRFNMCMHY